MDFKDYRILLEMFDSPYQTSPRKYSPENLKAFEEHNNVQDYQEHDILDDKERPDSYVQTFKRNGAYEVHHNLDKDTSGEMRPNSSGAPNPRFISTMMKFAKEKIDAGHRVRIVGNNVEKYGTTNTTMFDKYHQFGRIFSKKFGLHMTDPVPHSNSNPAPGAGDLKEFEIYKKEN